MEILDDPIQQIDPSTVSPRPAGQKYGLIWGAALIVVGLLGYYTGLTKPSIETNAATYLVMLISYGIGATLIVLAIREHREELGGFITGSRCTMVGLWTGLFNGLISAIWSIIFFTFIAPNFYDEIFEMTRAKLEDDGLSEDAIEMSMGMMEFMQNPIFLVIASIIGGIITGVIIGAIAGLFMRNKAANRL